MLYLSRTLKYSLILLAAARSTTAVETLPHDHVVAMAQRIPEGMDGELYVAYQPVLNVVGACDPYPAVDANGKIGRGLNPSGPHYGPKSRCSKSDGQVYVRSAPVGHLFALLFTWYMPKDQVDSLPGHNVRHDFEGVVVLLKSRNATDAANVLAVCPSARGTWTCSTRFILIATSPLVDYRSSKKHPDNTCYLAGEIRRQRTPGAKQPVVAWESMPQVARDALSQYNYGKVQVPFIDAHFNATLALARPTLPHNEILAMPQLTPIGMNGTLYLAYQPRLKVLHGCVPFPAVSADGVIGRGLKATGPSGGRHSKCNWSVGQVYVRSARVGKLFALLYTWYQPKDQRGSHGKRNDWEGAVIYLKNRYATDAANILAVCPSARGTWACATDFRLDGTYPLLQYGTHGHSDDNTCYLSRLHGEQQPLVAWESMPVLAAEALARFDFGKSQVPFIDAHFNDTLALAVPPH